MGLKMNCAQNQGFSTISIFAQGPQYGLIALAEVFTALTVKEFSYMEAPDGLKCFSMGLNQTALGLSFLISLGIESLVKTYTDWYDFDLKDMCLASDPSHLEYFLAILVVMSLVFSVVFPLVTRIPKTIDEEGENLESN
ncbi:protein NRT1/ PTR FAMILY 7.3-like [Lingula anatina]|uniref:Protein NRT1/ PTR FAMILY 7.3-like n=1 Tax=Lingula anatina TaxID=7574 RepID=A0A1S3JPI4_LINAN|nr:protein NRT1/ PTR FAMILY 7.3-like [Lingula anatina]|eukprot:XP_013412275.1 protein NRT1/ PTR FAMILY 7.3-like [Lingula anatina]